MMLGSVVESERNPGLSEVPMDCLRCGTPTREPLCSHCYHDGINLSPVVFRYVDTPDGMTPGYDCTYIEIIPATWGEFKATVAPPVIPV